MAKMDVQDYKDQYLKAVEERLIAKKDSLPNFTTRNLHYAIMTEMNRADVDTWEVDVPDDREQALKEAEERLVESMKKNVDLGVGQSF